MAFQGGGDGGVVGRAQDHRDLPWVSHPDGEVGGAQRGDEGVHLLAQHGGGTADPAASGPDLTGGWSSCPVTARAWWRGVRRRVRRGRSTRRRCRRPRVIRRCRGGPPFRPVRCRSPGRSVPGPASVAIRPTGRRWPGHPPQELTRRSCSPGSRSTNAGWVTRTPRSTWRRGVVDHPGPGVGVGVLRSAPCRRAVRGPDGGGTTILRR